MTTTPTSDLSSFLGADPTVARAYDNLQVVVASASLEAIKMALWNTVEEFYIQTTLKREWAAWSMSAGATTVTLAPTDTANWRVARVLSYSGLNSAYLEPPATLRDLSGGSTAAVRTGRALLALRPANFNVVSADVWSRWFDIVQAGALARLYSQPERPYSSPDLAKEYVARFLAGMKGVLAEVAPQSDLSQSLGANPDINRALNNIQALVPGVPIEIAKVALWNTIEDFFIQSTLRREFVFWRMDPGVLSLNFDPFSPDWRVTQILNYTGLSNARIEPPGRLRDLSSGPVALREGQVFLALTPSSFSAQMPADLWTRWFETILAGALMRLDSTTAKVNAVKYNSGIAQARASASRLFSRGSWRFPYFAGGRRR